MILCKAYIVQHVALPPAPVHLCLNAPAESGGTYSALILSGPDAVAFKDVKEGMRVIVEVADMDSPPGE